MRNLILAATIAGLLFCGAAAAQTSGGSAFVYKAPLHGLVAPPTCKASAGTYTAPGTYSFNAPEGCGVLAIDLLGAGGGGGWDAFQVQHQHYSSTNPYVNQPGGAGAAVAGSLKVNPGDSVVLVVGSAGGYTASLACRYNYAGTYYYDVCGIGGSPTYLKVNGSVVAAAAGGGGGGGWHSTPAPIPGVLAGTPVNLSPAPNGQPGGVAVTDFNSYLGPQITGGSFQPTGGGSGGVGRMNGSDGAASLTWRQK